MSYFDSMVRPCLLDRIKVKDDIFNGGIFNGLEYQVVTNPVTGRTWLDRNLGATRVATSSNDPDAYGWLYQWGRLSDGHQIRTSAITAILSSTDQPGHGDFIQTPLASEDWRNPSNDALWQGIDSINNPCPPGFRLPTVSEWASERSTWSNNFLEAAYNGILKLTAHGWRNSGGVVSNVGQLALFWTIERGLSSTIATNFDIRFSGTSVFRDTQGRVLGMAVRAIRDEQFD